jgi:hypothetical protein
MLEVITFKIDRHNEDRVLNVHSRVEVVNDLLRWVEDGDLRWDTFLLYMSFYDRGITEVRHQHLGLIWYKQPEFKP